MEEWEIPPPLRKQWRELEEIVDDLSQTPTAHMKIVTTAYCAYLIMSLAGKMKEYRSGRSRTEYL